MSSLLATPTGPPSFSSEEDALVFDLACATGIWSQGRTPAERAEALIKDLGAVDEARLRDLGKEGDSCSVCFRDFIALLKEEGGIVRLDKDYQCGHLFCKKDVVQWIKGENVTSPICRQGLVDPNCVQDGFHLELVGGTPRVLEDYRHQGIRVHNTPFRMPTAEERRERTVRLLREMDF